jgi:hypothetical protein
MVCLASKVFSAPFQNLDFEQVIQPLIPSDPSGHNRVPIGGALPGWSAFVAETPVSLVLTNDYFLDSAGVSLFGPGGSIVIAGNYSAFLQSGFPLQGDTGPINVTIAQTGQVPLDAQSILLEARVWCGPFSVSLGNDTLSLTPLSAGPNYTLYGANIPGLAGHTRELRITAVDQSAPPWWSHTYVWVDSISFSPEVIVPEPSIVALVFCGGLLFGLSATRKRPRR